MLWKQVDQHKCALGKSLEARLQYTFGLKHCWTYFLRTLADIQDLLEPLQKAISQMLIPAITEHRCNRLYRDILALPARLGGLGLENPRREAEREYSSSKRVTASLVDQIITQSHQLPDDLYVKSAQIAVRKERVKECEDRMERIRESAPPKIQRIIDVASEKESSVWLTALPLKELGFNLNKKEFRDAIKFHYDWPIDDIPSICVCGDAFPVDRHAMISKLGGFVIMRHNELRDLEVELLNIVCSDV